MKYTQLLFVILFLPNCSKTAPGYVKIRVSIETHRNCNSAFIVHSRSSRTTTCRRLPLQSNPQFSPLGLLHRRQSLIPVGIAPPSPIPIRSAPPSLTSALEDPQARLKLLKKQRLQNWYGLLCIVLGSRLI